jgi:hypothetical protein
LPSLEILILFFQNDLTNHSKTMKTVKFVFLFLTSLTYCHAQKAADLFSSTDHEITWVGIDFSHVKLIGDFSQFSGEGNKNAEQIKRTYFPGWNKLIFNEPKKFDIKGMLRREDILYDLEMMNSLNEKASTEGMEVFNPPKYTEADIKMFVSEYTLSKRTGISILMIAESLSKPAEEAFFHFLAIRNSDKSILLQQRLRGEPKGFGIRNYWAGAIFDIMEDIKKNKYNDWKRNYNK